MDESDQIEKTHHFCGNKFDHELDGESNLICRQQLGDKVDESDEQAVCGNRIFSTDSKSFAYRLVHKYKCLGQLYR